jgi:hypothetical protein
MLRTALRDRAGSNASIGMSELELVARVEVVTATKCRAKTNGHVICIRAKAIGFNTRSSTFAFLLTFLC